MGLIIEYLPGETPLDEDELDGILIKSVSNRGELDEFEQQNIEEAVQWVLSRSFKPGQVFIEPFIKQVHRKMLGNVWQWAGAFRQTNKNIGVDKLQISVALKSLLDDTVYWIDHRVYSPEEIAVRFKHRLVSIHCFANGNGRHSRLMADIIIVKLFKQPVFTWGAAYTGVEARKHYIKALKAADAGNYDLIIQFAQS